MKFVQLTGELTVHIFQNPAGRWQFEPIGTGEPWPGSEEYGSPEEATKYARLWAEDEFDG